MKKSIKKNFLWNSSYQLLLILVPLITIPYVSRVLGATQIGIYSYTYSVAYYFVLFAKLGMDQYGVRLISKTAEDRKVRSEEFCSAWCAQILLSIPIIIIYLIYAFLYNNYREISLLWALWVISAAADVSWLFFGVEEFAMPTIRNFVTKISGIIFIFAFCKDEGDLWAYVLGISLAYFANSAINLPYIGKYIDFQRPKWGKVKEHFIPNIRLFAPVVAVSLYMQFNKVLLGTMSNMEETGFYEYADKIARMPLTVVTALCTVMLPHMTAKLSAGKVDEARNILGKSFWIVTGTAVGVACCISSIASELVPVFLGSGFEPCKIIIPTVALALPFISGSNVLGMQYMLPSGLDRAYTRSVWTGAIVNIIVCLLLIPKIGAMGAAVATILAEGSVLLYQGASLRGALPIGQYMRGIVPFLCVGIVTFILTRLTVRALSGIFEVGWPLLIIETVFVLIYYITIVLIWCKRTNRLNEIISLIRK